MSSTAVDVVVPVYGSAALTRRCLESVVASRAGVPGDVVVVDDGSPDVATAGLLVDLAARGEIRLLRHDANRGFAAAVNTGIDATANDVVLLNSDTEVHGDWLRRLRDCAHRAPAIGTVTPFSNDATICSYPFPRWRRGLPPGLGLADLDDLFARANAGEVEDLPTGVGFCLLITRPCLTAVGHFDTARFGGGYGEETDFCQRARAAGWRNVLCADTFVYHAGRGSFGADGRRRARAAEVVLRTTYPDYAERVRAFIAADRLGRFRRRVDAVRTSRSPRQAAEVLAERLVERVARRVLG